MPASANDFTKPKGWPVRVLAFTKPFGPLPAARLGDVLAASGADGADLLVREGQTVDPADPDGIAVVAAELRARDLDVDVVTTDLVEADAAADRLLGACADAGVRLVRLGFYRYDPGSGYHRCRDAARGALGRLADLSARHGVQPMLQLHHATVHPSGALALALIHDLDVTIYADPGNQAKEGAEAWPMHLDLLGGRIACVGAKNAVWRETAAGWRCDWAPFTGGGVVAWPEIVAGLRQRDYAGPLSLHVHYPTADPAAAVRRDVARLRDVLR